MGERECSTQEALTVRAAQYVKTCNETRGGFRQAWRGLSKKTLPVALGLSKEVSVPRLFALLLRGALGLVAAIFPILLRKAAAASAVSATTASGANGANATEIGGHAPSSGIARLQELLSNLDSTDYWLAAAALFLAFVPRWLDAYVKKSKNKTELRKEPSADLAAAIESLTCSNDRATNTEALRFALQALRTDLTELVRTDSKDPQLSVTLLEFGEDAGTTMRVRVRIDESHDEVGRRIESWKFLAYYVARSGRWFIEHDFLSRLNPFEKVRLTVFGAGQTASRYRSIFFIPIIRSDEIEGPIRQEGVSEPTPTAIEYCLGVVCVHCTKPYRFWRWGDHAKVSGNFGDVAYSKSLPYSRLVRKLLEPNAFRMALEVQCSTPMNKKSGRANP